MVPKSTLNEVLFASCSNTRYIHIFERCNLGVRLVRRRHPANHGIFVLVIRIRSSCPFNRLLGELLRPAHKPINQHKPTTFLLRLGNNSPELRLPPSLLIPHDVHNLTMKLIIPVLKSIRINHDIGPALHPDRRSEARGQLDQNGLFRGQFDRVDAVSGCFDNSCNGLAFCEGVWRGQGFFGGG